MVFDFDTEIKRQTGTDGKEYKDSYSSSSCYGSPILDSRTVLVKTTEGKVLFSADGLKFPEWKVNADSDKKTCELLYKTSLMKDFKAYATCRNEDFQKAVHYLGNLSGYMHGMRFTKGGR